jgi:hypothetical protein
MTKCQKEVVAFDAFKKDIVQKKKWKDSPSSCDALYRHDAKTWFLIEFKNGQLEYFKDNRQPDTTKFLEIIRKLFESLFLLTKELGQTIDFTHKNLVFVLVYNEGTNGYLQIKDNATKLGNRKDAIPMSYLSDILPATPFNTSYFDKLYVKKAYICSKATFNNEFVKEYLDK